jgi:hypothetical protein
MDKNSKDELFQYPILLRVINAEIPMYGYFRRWASKVILPFNL